MRRDETRMASRVDRHMELAEDQVVIAAGHVLETPGHDEDVGTDIARRLPAGDGPRRAGLAQRDQFCERGGAPGAGISAARLPEWASIAAATRHRAGSPVQDRGRYKARSMNADPAGPV